MKGAGGYGAGLARHSVAHGHLGAREVAVKADAGAIG
jgi:hypothetical protein